jgi:hypothetical protein
MEILLLLAGVVLVFYGLIPGLGAIHVRNQWRRFRETVRGSVSLPPLRYRDVHGATEGAAGRFRFLGYLEALQEDTVWIRSSELSVSAHLKEGDIYLLPEIQGGGRPEEEMLSQEPPKRIPWKGISTLPEGTKVLVFGRLERSGGLPVFTGTREDPVTMIIYEGEERSILKGSIWTGRHKNELLNQFTFPSVAAGSFALFFLAYILFRNPLSRFSVLLAGTVSLFPVVLFLPPGVAFLFLYRYFWKRGRILRAERDLFQLPLIPFGARRPRGGERTTLAGGEPYAVETEDTLDGVIHRCREGYRIRTGRMVEPPTDDFYIFGVPEEIDPSGKKSAVPDFHSPRDPLVEYLVVPGNPYDLSLLCRKQARRYELVAGGSLLAGLLVNGFLVFVILGQIIR